MDSAGVISLDEQPAAPAVFRAPRRRVRRRLAYALALAALAGLCWWVLQTDWLASVVTIACLVQFAGAVRAASGSVEVYSDGIRVHTLFVTRSLPWAKITSCEVHGGLLGREIRLTRAVPHRRLRLPAPGSPYLIPDPRFDAEVQTLRDIFTAQRSANAPAVSTGRTPNPRRYWITIAAIFTAALLLEQPWGWPGGPQAVAVPDPCQMAAGHLTAFVGDEAGEHESAQPDPATIVDWCFWDFGGVPDKFVIVAIRQYNRVGMHSGTWRARGNLIAVRREVTGAIVGATPRLGDESILVEGSDAAGIFGRRGNVIALIVAQGEFSGYNRTDLFTVEGNILDAIRLG